MDVNRAKEIVATLAEGIDPTTGEVLPENSVYNKGDVVRALYAVLKQLDKKTTKIERHENAGKPWTNIEDEHLKDEFMSGVKTSDIAKEHGRTNLAIESQLDHLGLKKKSFRIFKQ